MCAISRYNGEGRGTRRAAKPCREDFFADVELVAKKALKLQPKLLQLFQKHIIKNEGETWDVVPTMTRGKISECVGAAFVAAKLYSVAAYFHA